MAQKVRVFLFVLMFILLAILPWWLNCVFLLILTIYIPFYPEVIFFGFIFDALYSDKRTFIPIGLTLALVTYVAVNLIRTRIRT